MSDFKALKAALGNIKGQARGFRANKLKKRIGPKEESVEEKLLEGSDEEEATESPDVEAEEGDKGEADEKAIAEIRKLLARS